MTKKYDAALSFAGEDRDFVRQVAQALELKGFKVFFDEFEQADLVGRNLIDHLSDVYQYKARICVLFLSAAYAAKPYTRLERQSAQATAFQSEEPYIIPVRLDDTEVKGILNTVAYISKMPPEGVAQIIAEKLRLNEPAGLRTEDAGGGPTVVARFDGLFDFDQATFFKSLEKFTDAAARNRIPLELRLPVMLQQAIEIYRIYAASADFNSPTMSADSKREFIQHLDQLVTYTERTLAGLRSLLLAYEDEHEDRLRQAVTAFVEARATAIAQSILAHRPLRIPPFDWEGRLRNIDVMHGLSLLCGLAYNSHLKGSELYIWVDVDARLRDRTSFATTRIYLPSVILLANRSWDARLSNEQFDKFVCPQLLDTWLEQGRPVEEFPHYGYFVRRPDALDFTVRGESAVGIPHFSVDPVTRKSVSKAVQALRDDLRQQATKENDPDTAYQLAAMGVPRLFRDGDALVRDIVWSKPSA